MARLIDAIIVELHPTLPRCRVASTDTAATVDLAARIRQLAADGAAELAAGWATDGHAGFAVSLPGLPGVPNIDLRIRVSEQDRDLLKRVVLYGYVDIVADESDDGPQVRLTVNIVPIGKWLARGCKTASEARLARALAFTRALRA